jgi:hypothetical protein
MIYFVKSKIERLAYMNSDSIKELHKLIGISRFIIADKSRECFPPYQECFNAIKEIDKIDTAGDNQRAFDRIKTELLSVYNKLIDFFSKTDKTPSTDVLFHGQDYANFNNELKYEFLVLEQNNIDFFASRKSPSINQPHDRLDYHIWIYKSDGMVKFGFNEDSDLPDNIKEQVKIAFDKVGHKYSQKK